MRLCEINWSGDTLPTLTKEHKVLSHMKRGAALWIRNILTPPFRQAYLIKLDFSDQHVDGQWYDLKNIFYKIPLKLVRKVRKHPDIMRYYDFTWGKSIEGKLYTNSKFFSMYVNHVDNNTDFRNMED